jgi:hypothetical protein
MREEEVARPGGRSTKRRHAPLLLLAAGGVASVVVSLPIGLAAGANKPASAPVGVSFTGGCKGTGTAKNGDGKVLDKATAPEAPGATTADPFKIARGGTVDWAGSTPAVFTDHHWWVHVDGIPIRSGGSPNGSHEKNASGVVKVDSYLPSWLGVTGVYYVNGSISGLGGTCSGAAYVRLTGDPATGLLLWVGIVFVLGGLVLLLGARPNWLAVLTTVPKAPSPPSVTTPSAPTTAPGPPTTTSATGPTTATPPSTGGGGT